MAKKKVRQGYARVHTFVIKKAKKGWIETRSVAASPDLLDLATCNLFYFLSWEKGSSEWNLRQTI